MLTNSEGKKVPSVKFRTLANTEWKTISSDDIFAQRTVIVFALPGAFTPTCSSTHVPRYNQLAPVFKKHGVDEIICLSVNDAFVMQQWQQDQAAENITFLPDGNGDFSRAMNMLVNKQELGFGERSWRYSMLVKNGIIEKMFIEPDQAGDPFEVSDADTMLAYIAPTENPPLDITVLSRPGCSFCAQAKQLLADAELDYDELVLNKDLRESSIRALTGQTSLPQVFINAQHIGGSEDLANYLKQHKAA